MFLGKVASCLGNDEDNVCGHPQAMNEWQQTILKEDMSIHNGTNIAKMLVSSASSCMTTSTLARYRTDSNGNGARNGLPVTDAICFCRCARAMS